MDNADIQNLILKHTEEITQLQIASGQMMMLWKAVGAFALVALGAYITTMVAS